MMYCSNTTVNLKRLYVSYIVFIGDIIVIKLHTIIYLISIISHKKFAVPGWDFFFRHWCAGDETIYTFGFKLKNLGTNNGTNMFFSHHIR